MCIKDNPNHEPGPTGIELQARTAAARIVRNLSTLDGVSFRDIHVRSPAIDLLTGELIDLYELLAEREQEIIRLAGQLNRRFAASRDLLDMATACGGPG